MRRPSMRRRPIRLIMIGILLLGVSWLVFPHVLHAQTATPVSIEDTGGQVGLASTDLKVIVLRVIRWFLGIVSLVALVYVIYGGYVWLTSAGDEAKIIKAKRIILQALIGIVIILLSWAIVYFVQKTVLTNVLNNENGNDNSNVPCLPGDPGCTTGTPSSLNITAIATCSAPTDYAHNVPRSSNVAVFFNRSIDSTTAKKAVEESKNLQAVHCTDATCSTTGAQKPVDQQSFALNSPTATQADPKTEWVTKSNSNAITLFHKTFSQDPASAGYRLFAANNTYRVQIPKFGATNALIDTTPQQHTLQKCEAANGGPIPGDDPIAPNCKADNTTNTLQWTFTTGTATDGPPMNVTSTVPSSAYLGNGTSGAPDRNVNRSPVLGIQFSTAVDPSSFDIGNMVVTKYIDPPTQAGGWTNGTLAGTPLPANEFTFTFRSDGTGAWLRLKEGKVFDAFTWYQIKVSGVRNLCGAAMQPDPFTWSFETNDVVPGVAKVYPANAYANACPSTKVLIVFNTSMWRGEGTNCDVGDGSFITSASLRSGSSPSGRNLVVQDPLTAGGDPNQSCRVYAFDPTTTQLVPGQTYSAAVRTDLVIDSDGNKLEYGDGTSGKPWHFTVATAEQCIQPPLITRIAPSQGKDGQCISVIGNYFEKPSETNSDGTPETGDALALGNRNQLTDPDVVWTDRSIVTTVDGGTVGQSGSLARDQNYSYKVTVNYPAPIGPLSDTATMPFYLQSGAGSLGPCLRSLSKTSGPIGTTLSASGKRFGTFGAGSSVLYPLHPQGLQLVSGWSDTSISNLKVRDTTGLGTAPVQVVDQSGNVSNPIDFTTTPTATPGVGAPRVLEQAQCNLTGTPQQIPSPNPRDGTTNICLTTKPEVWFTTAMDPASLTAAGNITINDCTASPCTAVNGVTIAVRGDHKSIQLNTPTLTANHKYTVTISGNVQSEALVKMGTDYSWRFTTQSGTADCPVTHVTINESSKVFTELPIVYPLSSTARTASCQAVPQANVNYTWTVRDGVVVAVTPSVNPANAVARDIATPQTNVMDQVTVKADTKTSAPINLSYDPTYCSGNDNAYCATNRFGEQCGTGAGVSICQNNHCTPVINSIDPNNGATGTWTTVRGCWFGSYSQGSSKVIYGSDQDASAKEGIAPNSQQCGAPGTTWTNEWIVREVPAGAVTGSVQVNRADGVTAESTGNYTVNSTQYPGLCKIAPARASAGGLITLSGIRFGSASTADQAQNATDVNKPDAVLYNLLSGGIQQALFPYPSWTTTAVGTQLGVTMANGTVQMSVKKGGVSSNKLPYTVGSTGTGGTTCTQACSGDGDACPNTSTGVKQGCSLTTFCCEVRPVITSFEPPQGSTQICRNTLVSIGFSRPLAASSINVNSVLYQESGVNKTVADVDVVNTSSAGKVTISPGLLAAGATERFSFAASSLRGTNGVLADLTGLPLTFTAGGNICTMDRLAITPVTYTASAAAETNSFIGTAWHGTTQLARINGVYTWDWSWLSGDTQVVSIQSTGTTNYFAVAQATAVGPGSTNVTLKAKVTTNAANPNDKTQLSVKAKYVSDFCSQPWTFSDSTTNCDTGGACKDYHFNLRYCRTNGSNTLPDFNYLGALASTGVGSIDGENANLGRLKSMFFKEAGENKKDIIGLLIFDNPNFLSPYDWFSDRFPGQTVGSSKYIAGYPAVQTGTTAYIGVTDIENGQPRGLMFVFDFNSNEADGATKNIYNRLMASLEFNTNLGDDTERLALQRDTQRRQDLAGVKALAEAYKTKNGTYPTLGSGSYLPGISTSKWPSWQSTLGSELGRALSTDPANAFAKHCSNDLTRSCVSDSQCSNGGTCSKAICATPYDSGTCWAETTKQFTCPKGSSIYLYRMANGNLDLYANMEYTSSGSFVNYDPNQNACSGSGSTCACFNFHL